MKKILLSLATIGLLVVPAVGLAQGYGNAPNVTVMTAIESVINWMFTFLIIVAIIFIIIAAFYFVTASGDPTKVGTARNFVMYALIGVAVAFLARGLIVLVDTIVNK